MTPEMEAAMQLQGATDGYLQDGPDADYEGESPETWAARGVANAHQYMAKNGPIQPTHRAPKTMTKAQLAEQIMNEEQGYPSNLDEANKTKDLENRVSGIETGISQILNHLQSQVTASPTGSPVVSQLEGPSYPESTPPNGNDGGTPVSPEGAPTQTPVPSGIVSRQNPQSIGSVELPEPTNKPQMPRQVTLSNGKKVMVPRSTSTQAMNLGPQATNAPIGDDELAVEEELWDEQLAVVPQVDPEEPKADPKLERVATMVLQVNEFLAGRDIHRDWRKLLAGHIHRHVGYSGWPRPMQAEFDTVFKSYLSDSGFVTSICRKVYDMDMGYALGVKPVVSFLVACAGFTAFTMIGLD